MFNWFFDLTPAMQVILIGFAGLIVYSIFLNKDGKNNKGSGTK